MVIPEAITTACAFVLAEVEAPQRAIDRLDAPSKIYALLTLVTLVLIGIVLILAVIVGANRARRRARVRFDAPNKAAKTTDSSSTIVQNERTDDSDAISTAETVPDHLHGETRGERRE